MKILIKTMIRIAFITLFCVLAWKVMNDYTSELNWLGAYLYLTVTTVIVPAIIDLLWKPVETYDGNLEIVDAGEEGTTYLMHIDQDANFEDKDELRIRVDK